MKSQSAYLEGFRRGLLDARPDETLDQARERFQRETEAMNFDTATLQSCQMTIAQYANHYRASIRTIERLKAAGVDLDDPAAVAAHLLTVQSPSLPMLERVGQLLDEIESPPAIQ